MKLYLYRVMNWIFNHLMIFNVFILLFKWIRKGLRKTDTRLFNPESLNHLDKADEYIKKYYS